jgi:hypothetical protein
MSTEITITPSVQAGYDAQIRTTTITRGTERLAWNLPWDRALKLAEQFRTYGAVTLTQPEHGPFPARTLIVR